MEKSNEGGGEEHQYAWDKNDEGWSSIEMGVQECNDWGSESQKGDERHFV